MPLSLDQFNTMRSRYGDDLAFAALFGDKTGFRGDPVARKKFGRIGSSGSMRHADRMNRKVNGADRVRKEIAGAERGRDLAYWELYSQDFAIQDVDVLENVIPVLEDAGSGLSTTEVIALVEGSLRPLTGEAKQTELAARKASQVGRARAEEQAGPAADAEGLFDPTHLAKRRLVGGRNFFAGAAATQARGGQV